MQPQMEDVRCQMQMGHCPVHAQVLHQQQDNMQVLRYLLQSIHATEAVNLTAGQKLRL